MISRLPISLRSHLHDPTAWASDSHLLKRGSAAHRLAAALWTSNSEYLSAPHASCITIESAGRPYCKVELFNKQKYVIRISQQLIECLAAYARVWVYAHADPQSRDQLQRAQDATLSMAQRYRRSGELRIDWLPLAPEQAETAVAYSVTALRFLVLHENAHIQLKHLEIARTDADCLDIEAAHVQEFAADAAAATTLAHEDLKTGTRIALEILFEFLHLIAFGVPGFQGRHPLAYNRYLSILADIYPDELRAATNRLRDPRRAFWYLQP